MKPIEHKITAPVCACGSTMKRAEWQEPALRGGVRTVSGFACSTPGCEGNFPERWKKVIDQMPKVTHG